MPLVAVTSAKAGGSCAACSERGGAGASVVGEVLGLQPTAMTVAAAATSRAEYRMYWRSIAVSMSGEKRVPVYPSRRSGNKERCAALISSGRGTPPAGAG